MALVTADTDMPILRAAAVKPPLSTTRTSTLMAINLFMHSRRLSKRYISYFGHFQPSSQTVPFMVYGGAPELRHEYASGLHGCPCLRSFCFPRGHGRLRDRRCCG